MLRPADPCYAETLPCCAESSIAPSPNLAKKNQQQHKKNQQTKKACYGGRP